MKVLPTNWYPDPLLKLRNPLQHSGTNVLLPTFLKPPKNLYSLLFLLQLITITPLKEARLQIQKYVKYYCVRLCVL